MTVLIAVALCAASDVARATPISWLLGGSGVTSTDKVMIVAHPDDETLWGGAHVSEGGWLVVCLSNKTTHHGGRAVEFHEAMGALGAEGIILEYPDKESWDGERTREDLAKDVEAVLACKNWKLVVTHNPDGEYGHQHHMAASQVVTVAYNKVYPGKDGLYYFGKYYDSQSAIDAARPALRPIGAAQLELKERVLGTIYVSQDTRSAHHQMYRWENWIKANEWAR